MFRQAPSSKFDTRQNRRGERKFDLGIMFGVNVALFFPKVRLILQSDYFFFFLPYYAFYGNLYFGATYSLTNMEIISIRLLNIFVLV